MSIDQRNADRAISYHGPSLIDQLAREEADVKLPSFLSLPQAGTKKEPKRDEDFDDRLVTFIAKKADLLFKKYEPSARERVDEEEETPDLYAIVPPLEAYLEIPEEQRLEHFFRCVDVGDVMVCSVSSVHDGGLQLFLLCFRNKKARDIDTLKISAFCPTREIPVQYKHDDLMESFKKKDKLVAVVISVTPATEKIMVSLRHDRLSPESKGIILGHIEEQDLPIHYRRLQRLDGATYTEHMQRRLGFSNASNVSMLCSLLGIEKGPRPSLLRNFHGRSFPKEECAESLRKTQSHNWAMKSVAEGVSHFKKGKYTDAVQYLNKALKIDEDNVEAYVARGALYANNESYSRALEDFWKALELNSEHKNAQKYTIQTLMVYARTLIDAGEDEAAIRQLEDALRLDPNLKEARNAVSKLQAKVALTRQDSAVREDDSDDPDKGDVSMKDMRTQPDGSEAEDPSCNEKTTETLRRLLKEEKTSKSKKKKRRSRSSPDSRSPDPYDNTYMHESKTPGSVRKPPRLSGEYPEEGRRKEDEGLYREESSRRSKDKSDYLRDPAEGSSSRHSKAAHESRSSSRNSDSGYTDDRSNTRHVSDSDSDRSRSPGKDDLNSSRRRSHRFKETDVYSTDKEGRMSGQVRRVSRGGRPLYGSPDRSDGKSRMSLIEDRDDRRCDKYKGSEEAHSSVKKTEKSYNLSPARGRNIAYVPRKSGNRNDSEDDVDEYLYGSSAQLKNQEDLRDENSDRCNDDRNRSPGHPAKRRSNYDWENLEGDGNIRGSNPMKQRNFDEYIFRNKPTESYSHETKPNEENRMRNRSRSRSPGVRDSNLAALEYRIGEQIRLEQERINRETDIPHDKVSASNNSKDDYYLGKYDLDLRGSPDETDLGKLEDQNSAGKCNDKSDFTIDMFTEEAPEVTEKKVDRQTPFDSSHAFLKDHLRKLSVVSRAGKENELSKSAGIRKQATKWKPLPVSASSGTEPSKNNAVSKLPEYDRESLETLRISIYNDFAKQTSSDATTSRDANQGGKAAENGAKSKVELQKTSDVAMTDHEPLHELKTRSSRSPSRERKTKKPSSRSSSRERGTKRRRSASSSSRSTSSSSSSTSSSSSSSRSSTSTSSREKARKKERKESERDQRRSSSKSRRRSSRSRSRSRSTHGRSRSRKRGSRSRGERTRSRSRGERTRSRSRGERARSRSLGERARSSSRGERARSSPHGERARSRKRRSRSSSRSRLRRRDSRSEGRIVTRCVKKPSSRSSSSSSSSSSRSSPRNGHRRRSGRKGERYDGGEERGKPEKGSPFYDNIKAKIDKDRSPRRPSASYKKSFTFGYTQHKDVKGDGLEAVALQYGKWDSPDTSDKKERKGKNETLDEMEKFLKMLKEQKKSSSDTTPAKPTYKRW